MTAWSVAPVCDECLERVGPQEGTLCSVCGEALGLESARFAAALGATVCTMCRMAPPDFTRAVSFATYREELREVLHLLKYNGRRRLAHKPLGQWLAAAVAGVAGEAAAEMVVVAVPLFPARERMRGFNQSVLLAEGAIQHLRRLHPEWKLCEAHGALARVRDTDAQFGLNPQQRRNNLRGAFRVRQPELVRGREVLLIDDIMTTGSTARECARVLMRAGASKVWVATVARAQAEVAAGTSAGSGDVAMWTLQEPDPRMRKSFVSRT